MLLSVREIKELTMRTSSHLEQSKEIISGSFAHVTLAEDRPYLIVGLLPVFFEDFLVDLRAESIQLAVRRFSRTAWAELGNISYSFDGIERRDGRFDHIVQFRRNGLLRVSQQVPLIQREGADQVGPVAIDRLLRQVVTQTPFVYEAAGIGPPYIASITLRIQRELTGVYSATGGLGEEHTPPVEASEYRFPFMQIDELVNIDRILQPFCDQVHQLFGKEGSSSFNADGVWIERNR